MIGYKVTLTAPGGSPVDYTAYTLSVHIDWPATTDLPTATVIFSNTGGIFPSVPLFGTLAITLPNNLGTFVFPFEKEDFQFAPNAGSGISGRQMTLSANAAPELLFLSEGNLDVVGTDLPVGEWNARLSASYTPYPSTFVTALGTPLMDIGNVLTALLHTTQPNQIANYRGRAGYDCTGTGLRSSILNGLPVQVDFTAGASTGWSPSGLYIKGQWKVGLGQTGAQKAAFDVIKDICQDNVIDGTGTPQVIDFYVDPTQTPPLLTAFERTTQSSAQTFVVGQDYIIALDLPVDTTNVKNFIIYWGPTETVYPNSGDAWSNYDTTLNLDNQWAYTAGASGSGTLTVSSTTPFNSGTSNQYTDSSTTPPVWNFYSTFDLPTNGYAILDSAVQGNRQVSTVQFYFMRTNSGISDGIQLILYDPTGANSIKYSPAAWTVGSLPSAGVWQQLISAALPQTGSPPSGGWSLLSGAWTFGTTPIGQIAFEMTLSATSPAQSFLIDYVQFVDSWDFSPVYSYYPLGPGSTTLTNGPSAGSNVVLDVATTAAFVKGQYVAIDLGQAAFEVAGPITAIPSTTSITVGSLANSHSIGAGVIAATHDPNSIAAYGARIFNYNDYYLNTGNSDSAESITFNILTTRKGKSSSGTITVSGYSPQLQSIKPGYTFGITSPEDVYQGSATTDSTIAGWIADNIAYDVQTGPTGGFTSTITVEPYYQVFGALSADHTPRDVFALNNRNASRNLRTLNRMTLPGGRGSIR